MSDSEPKRMPRREALKWVGAALAAYPMLEWTSLGAADPAIKRTFTDPDLLNPGKLWERTLTADQLRTVAALCDVIIPADDKSPSASKVGVPDFIDEWVSAPFEPQQNDRQWIMQGLLWLDAESKKRFEKAFVDLKDEQKTAICDDICFSPRAKPEFRGPAAFFARMRDLTSTGFYTTKEGMADLPYKGNVPLLTFDGPPKEVLEYLKLV